ncbi:S8 family serine peptidase, partial [Streptomyces sp. NPDC055796]
MVTRHGGTIRRTYDAALNGYSVRLSERQARRLAADPAVAEVAQNRTVRLDAAQPDPPSWGVDRIDRRRLPLDGSYTYPDSAGQGVTAYVIDTGVNISHQDFGGRASYSNHGPLVDLFAPGDSITSAVFWGDDWSTTMSGTSMASPHVAGAAALYLADHRTATPAQVAAAPAAAGPPREGGEAGPGAPPPPRVGGGRGGIKKNQPPRTKNNKDDGM